MVKVNEKVISVVVKDVLNKFKLLENQESIQDSIRVSSAKDLQGDAQEMSDSIIHDLTRSKRVPAFKLKFPHNDAMVRKTPIVKEK